jgi:hypothetical protein
MKRSDYIFIAMLFIAAPVSAQDARLAGRLDDTTRDSVERIIAGARAAGLPSEPLLQKALEGSSKKARPADILRAVTALAARIQSARGALGAAATEAELVAGASALYAGVDTPTLARIQSLRQHESIAMPLLSLSYFIASGVDRVKAIHWVESVVSRRVPADELFRVQQSIERDIRAGTQPRAATEARVEALLKSHGAVSR